MQDGVYYVQEHKEDFYVDSDWDGDTFTCNPLYAKMHTEPWQEGRFGIKYKCRKIRVSTLDFKGHSDPVMHSFVSQSTRRFGKLRYFMECPQCKTRTKDYATEETAREMWHTMTAECRKQIAQLATED